MQPNALTNIAWIPTTKGNMTVRDVLLSSPHANENSENIVLATNDILLKSNPGFFAGSVLRILRDVTVLAERYRKKTYNSTNINKPDKLAIDQAIALLTPYVNPLDASHPFLQRPVIYNKPVGTELKKLSPAMAPNTAESFWHLSFSFPKQLSIEDAVLWLAVNHHYSLAGNNSYDNIKCTMGAPGIRFLGIGCAATEVFWRNESVYQTLLMNIPSTWLYGEDLPAWTRQKPTGDTHNLWDASWSSNAPACKWENNKLVGVTTSGIPEDYYIDAQGKNKQSRKSWWDTRNESDPFYLYTPNKDGFLKAQRLDFGRDLTDLAVTWNANGNPREMLERQRAAIMSQTEDAEVTFLRHTIQGTSSSPSIRDSEVLIPPHDSLWAPREELWEITEKYATIILNMRKALVYRFGKSQNDKAATLPNLEYLREDASTAFWRNINPLFTKAMVEGSLNNGNAFAHLVDNSARITLNTYDQITLPYQQTMVAEITISRKALSKKLGKIKNEALS